MPASKTVERLRIGLLENQPLRAAGLRAVFDTQKHVDLVDTDLAGLIGDLNLQLAFVGLHDSNIAVPVIETIHASRPDIRLLVVGPGGDEELVLEAIGIGAKAYVDDFASPEQVLHAVEVVSQGSIWAPRRILSIFIDRMLRSLDHLAANEKMLLTVREQQVLRLVLAAQSNREIAGALGLTERTVKSHITKLMRKTGVDSRLGLSVHSLAHTVVASARAKKR